MNRGGSVLSASRGCSSQTLIIKVLPVNTGDLLEAGCGEREIRGTLFAADFVPRNRRRRPAQAGGGASCDCGGRSNRVGAGIFGGAGWRGGATHYSWPLAGG